MEPIRYEASKVEVTVLLPRVRVHRGRVGHLVYNGEEIIRLNDGVSREFMQTMCHAGEGYMNRYTLDELDEDDHYRRHRYYSASDHEWAAADLPTCQACIKAGQDFGVLK